MTNTTMTIDTPQRTLLTSLLSGLQRVYAVIEINQDGNNMLRRVDVKPQLVAMLDNPAITLHQVAHDINDIAEELPFTEEAGSAHPADSDDVEEWYVSLTQPGTMMVDDIMDALQPVIIFDSSYDAIAIAANVGLALSLIDDDNEADFIDFVEQRMDGELSPYEIVTAFTAQSAA